MDNSAIRTSPLARTGNRGISQKRSLSVSYSHQVKLKKTGTIFLFVLPALIPLIVFWIYPILRSVWISFTDWDFMTPEYNFVFFKNYISLFRDSRFYLALWNTLVFTAGTLLPTIVGVPAKEALDEAQKTAQAALDEALGK